MRLSSYPSIYNLGHKAIADLLQSPVYVQEKVDGSQFSFGLAADGTVLTRSKGAQLFPETADKLFKAAVEYVHSIKDTLMPGFTYRGEVLHKPKHNTLAYDRVPRHNIVLFDINTAEETYMPYPDMLAEANRIDLEVVPLLYQGTVTTVEQLKALLDTPSFLGGQKIEGVVVKPVGYWLFGKDKKALMGKFVSEAFKEVHQGEWRKANPSSADFLQQIVTEYRTPARWNKAVQHLREAGQLEQSPRDIGRLMKEVGQDIYKECADEIKSKLFGWAWPKIQRAVIAGLPEWYKDELLKEQFNNGTTVTESKEVLDKQNQSSLEIL